MKNGLRWRGRGQLMIALSVACATTVQAQRIEIQGGQVNGAGATLFVDFFKVPASTNDDLNCGGRIGVDGDLDCLGQTYTGFDLDRLSCGNSPVDQLSPFFTPGEDWTGWWLFQYRSVGSVEGFGEFISYQTCGTIPQAVPSEAGLINRFEFARQGNRTWGGPWADCDGDGDLNDESGTPVCPETIDFGFTDVIGSWAVRAGVESNGFWSRRPTEDGYGWNYIPSSSGFISRLQSLGRDCDGNGTEETFLNTNTSNPDQKTMFGFSVAWVPIVPIANRGTGLRDLKMTEFQHVMVAGRMPNGENLVGVTRDVGSGTRNGEMNTAGIDPAWGRGDNIGPRFDDGAIAQLGPRHQPTNGGSSSNVEDVTRNRRLGLGYTGLAGGSRAARDALAGLYEILNLMNDHVGGTRYVRPEVRDDSNPNFSPILDNCDPDTGWRLGGTGTFSMVGDFRQTDPNQPDYMENQAAADYFRNLECSVLNFEAGFDRDEVNNMPGQYLALTFFLLAGMDCLPLDNDPTTFVTNPTLNQALQDYMRANNTLEIGQDTPPYGSVNIAGFVPRRASNPDFNNDGIVDSYSDGSVNGNYINPESGLYNVSSSFRLNERNQIGGDFNNDKRRNLNDIAGLMQAIQNPRAYQSGIDFGGNRENMPFSGDYVIVEIIGDFDGDGNFNARDVRYFADGLAMTTGGNPKLDRKEGFKRVDDEWLALTGNGNYFGTTLATGVPYTAGASRADIAGGNDPIPGAYPNGYDGTVDCADIDYVYANFGDYTDLDQAVFIDLSADMNGDLVINQSDVDEVVRSILCTQYGDVNLDGSVNATDVAIVTANQGRTNAGWCDGDFNGDGVVNAADLAIVNANLGFFSSCLGGCASDACNGTEALVAKAKAKGGGCQVKAVLKKATPGATYGIVMPSGACQRKAANSRGKVVVKEFPSASGTASVPTCGLTANVTCP